MISEQFPSYCTKQTLSIKQYLLVCFRVFTTTTITTKCRPIKNLTIVFHMSCDLFGCQRCLPPSLQNKVSSSELSATYIWQCIFLRWIDVLLIVNSPVFSFMRIYFEMVQWVFNYEIRYRRIFSAHKSNDMGIKLSKCSWNSDILSPWCSVWEQMPRISWQIGSDPGTVGVCFSVC